jgi:hypothetical protein
MNPGLLCLCIFLKSSSTGVRCYQLTQGNNLVDHLAKIELLILIVMANDRMRSVIKSNPYILCLEFLS